MGIWRSTCDSLADDADLYQAGMTSHASVNVMLALEDNFDIEFPDAMLNRGVFESIASIDAALERGARQRRMSVAVDATDQALLEAVRRIADEVAGADTPIDVDREARFPRETIEALREARAAVGLRPRPSSAAAASPSRRSRRPASSSAGAAARARWSSRCTRSRSSRSSATSTTRPGSRTTCARSPPSSA